MRARVSVGLLIGLLVAASRLLGVEPATPLVSASEHFRALSPSIVSFLRGREQVCTGTLIDRAWVVTSLHCASRLCDGDPGRISLLVGPNIGLAREFRIREIVCYPSTDPNRSELLHNDIMMIRIPKVFGADSSRPTLAAEELSTGSAGVAAGFARSADNPSRRSDAQTVELERLSDQDCEAFLNRGECGAVTSLGEAQFCAGSTDSSVFRGIHPGDSGGPLFVVHEGRPKLVGVASQACPNGLTIYESVPDYRRWIVDTVCRYYSYRWGHLPLGRSTNNCVERLTGAE